MSNFTDLDGDLRVPMSSHMKSLRPLFYTVYIFVLSVGLCGNGSIIFMVLRYKPLRTVINFYFVNIAIADLVLCGFGTIFTPLSTLLRNWPFGQVLCYLFSYAEILGTFVHAYTLATIALYQAKIVKNHSTKKPDTSLNLFHGTCFGIWTCGMLLSVPYAMFKDKVLYELHGQCVFAWPAYLKVPVPIVSFAILVVLPFLVTSACNLYVWYYVYSATIRRVISESQTEKLKNGRHTSSVLSVMVATYVLCMAPIYIIKWLTLFYTAARLCPYMDVLSLASHAIKISAVCFTAVFFSYLNDKKFKCEKKMAERQKKARLVREEDL